MDHFPVSWPSRLFWTAAILLSSTAAEANLTIPYEKYALKNGMTVILHEDHSLPVVAVNIAVKVGSHNEQPRRTGFAHLFEHLMFMGTHRVPTKVFDSKIEATGGWNNAWTSQDLTDYFDVGPSHALSLFLWLEADRFSSLGTDMTLEKLNTQRDVVRNERRQTSENQPYGIVELRLPELLYPESHPYHHPVIGSHQDLEAATVSDTKSFFDEWYVPNNLSMVVAGDFQPNEVKNVVEKYFGVLTSRQIPSATISTTPSIEKPIRETVTDNVTLPKVVMAWHSPAHYADGDAELDLLSAILQDGKSSRLYKALVYDHPLAQEISATQRSAKLSSQFVIEAIAQPNVTLDQLEKSIDEQISLILKNGIQTDELMRAKNQYETSFVIRLQSVAERASQLNMYETATNNPGFLMNDLSRYRNATAEGIQSVAKRTLDLNKRVILRVVPSSSEKK